MRIIQNLACIEIGINPNDTKFKILKDILAGKKINSIFFFASTEDKTILLPITETMVAQYADIVGINLFLNVFNFSKRVVYSDLDIRNILLNTESNHFNELSINQLIDLNNLFVNSKSTIASSYKLLCYITYQTENLKPVLDEVNSSVTFTIPVTSEIQDIKISDIIGNQISDRPIREIRINSGSTPGYLNLISKDGKRHIENAPFALFGLPKPKSFIIDPFIIDPEKSSLLIRSMFLQPDFVQITFIF